MPDHKTHVLHKLSCMPEGGNSVFLNFDPSKCFIFWAAGHVQKPSILVHHDGDLFGDLRISCRQVTKSLQRVDGSCQKRVLVAKGGSLIKKMTNKGLANIETAKF